MVTSTPLTVNTNVIEPGRRLKPLLSSKPVPARITACARIAATPMFSPSQGALVTRARNS